MKRIQWGRPVGAWPLDLRKEIEPIVKFVNEELGQDWNESLLQTMGRERTWVRAHIAKNGKTEQVIIESGDLPMMQNEHSEFDIRIGGDCRGGKLLKWEWETPKIFDQVATRSRVLRLKEILKEILDLLVTKVELVANQRAGLGDTSWKEKKKVITSVELVPPFRKRQVSQPVSDDLPWSATHFEEEQEILKAIKKHWGGEIQRKEIVTPYGRTLFEDHGEDAGKTVLFEVARLTEEMFWTEQQLLKKCPSCGRFFLQEHRRRKKYCSEKCKMKDHNRKWVESGKAKRYMSEKRKNGKYQ